MDMGDRGAASVPVGRHPIEDRKNIVLLRWMVVCTCQAVVGQHTCYPHIGEAMAVEVHRLLLTTHPSAAMDSTNHRERCIASFRQHHVELSTFRVVAIDQVCCHSPLGMLESVVDIMNAHHIAPNLEIVGCSVEQL